AKFYNPKSKTKGSSGGEITKVYEYGDCVGKVKFSATKLSNNQNIQVGYKNV
ncbi:hypothetical protein BG000_002454, partial [Podila horticola]